MPADRVFERVEKILPNHGTIVHPQIYHEYFNEVGRARKKRIE